MTQKLQETAAAEVRAELARQRMTQAQLAAELGRSEAYLTRRLKGEVAWDLRELSKIAEVLGVPVAQFLPAGPVRAA